jgi:Inhibitor of apoptosis-promoting Bax1
MSLLFLLVVVNIANLFFGSLLIWRIEFYLGLIVFCLLVLFDMQLIIEKRKMGDTDFIWHALNLPIDSISIFRRILIILLNRENRETFRSYFQRTEFSSQQLATNPFSRFSPRFGATCGFHRFYRPRVLRPEVNSTNGVRSRILCPAALTDKLFNIMYRKFFYCYLYTYYRFNILFMRIFNGYPRANDTIQTPERKPNCPKIKSLQFHHPRHLTAMTFIIKTNRESFAIQSHSTASCIDLYNTIGQRLGHLDGESFSVSQGGRILPYNNSGLHEFFRDRTTFLTVLPPLRGGTNPPATELGATKSTERSNAPACIKYFLDTNRSASTWLTIHKLWATENGWGTQPQLAYNLLSLLPPEMCSQLANIPHILSQPTAYDELSKAILNLTDPTPQDLFTKYFRINPIGDMLPSEHLRKSRTELASLGTTLTLNNDVLRQLFIQSLPPNLQLLLAVVPASVSLDDVAAIADKSIEVIRKNQTPPIVTAAIAPAQDDISTLTSTTLALKESIATLTQTVEQLSTTHQRARTQKLQDKPGPVCFYHRKFAKDAKHCQFGCKFYEPSFKPTICVYHATFQENARKCVPGCTWKEIKQTSLN